VAVTVMTLGVFEGYFPFQMWYVVYSGDNWRERDWQSSSRCSRASCTCIM